MNLSREHWYISFTDFWSAFKNSKIKIALIAFFLGLFLFYRHLERPLTYTAEGIFKISGNSQGGQLTNLLQNMMGGNTAVSDDTKSFLDSVEVMKHVVKKLDLQGHISPKVHDGPITRAWKNLRLEGNYHHFAKNKRPPSSILTGNVIVPDRELFPLTKIPFSCQKIEYPKTYSTQFCISFTEDGHFDVLDRDGKRLGSSSLDSLFSYDGIHFSVIKNENEPCQGQSQEQIKGQKFTLTLIPLQAAAKSLKNSIILKPDKTKQTLLQIAYCHSDPLLAKNVVNGLMEAYHEYLLAIGETKIAKQISYLEKRKDENELALAKTANDYRDFIVQHIGAKGFINTGAEMEYLTRKQGETQALLLNIILEIQKLDPSLKDLSTTTIFEKIEEWRKNNPEILKETQFFSVEGIKGVLEAQQLLLTDLELEQEKYDICIDKVSQTEFDIAELITLFENPVLVDQFQRIRNLNFNLFDKKNWSPKEQDSFKQRIETEKTYLLTLLPQLKASKAIEKKVLQEKIDGFRKIALSLLMASYEQHVKQLEELKSQMQNLPEKWFFEKKFENEKTFHAELFKLFNQSIEAKNLSVHLQNLDSFPLQYASLPELPNHPRLLRKFMMGIFLGVFLSGTFLFFKTLFKGATASKSNLKGVGFSVLERFDRRQLLYWLHKDQKESTVVLVTSKTSFPFHPILNDSLIEIDFANDDRILNGKKLDEFLTTLKRTYKWIVIHNAFDLNSVETKALLGVADKTFFHITDENLTSFSNMPKDSLFLVQEKEIIPEFKRLKALFSRQKEKSLRQIEPLLKALINEFPTLTKKK